MQPSPPAATPKEKGSAKEEPKKPTNKELAQAEAEARIKEETARKAQARAQTLTARIDALHQSIRLEEKMLATARKKLREDVISMTVEATEKLIGQKMDEARDRELVGSFIDELETKQL